MKAPDSMTMKQFASGGERLFAEIPTGFARYSKWGCLALELYTAMYMGNTVVPRKFVFSSVAYDCRMRRIFVFNSNIIYIAVLRRNGEKYEQKNFIAP